MSASPMFLLGLIVGLLVLIALVAAVYFAVGRHRGQRKYDERQTFARLKAFRAAFFVLSAYLLLNAFVESVFDVRWGDAVVEPFIGIAFAMTVFVVICVFEDAYFALNEKRSFYMKLFAAIAAINAVPVAVNLLEGGLLVSDGLVTFRVMNLVVLAMFVILFIALATKALISRGKDKEQARDEDGAS